MFNHHSSSQPHRMFGLALAAFGWVIALGSGPVQAQATVTETKVKVEVTKEEGKNPTSTYFIEGAGGTRYNLGSPEATATVQTNANYTWTIIAAALVFFMQAGFALVECGFTRAKNATNIVMKNLLDFCIGTIAFWAVGFGLMFGSNPSGLYGTNWFAMGWNGAGAALPSGIENSDTTWPFTFWFFQTVFAATAATIVSGAMAERTKFVSYIFYSALITIVVYPVFGSWAWNGLFGGWNGGTNGWLGTAGFIDYAGSTVVHSIGGWAALAGAIVIGLRVGKFKADGTPNAIPGHNLPMGMLGVFILWFGWYGFNAGSTTSAIPDVGWIAMNTTLAACAGTLSAMVAAWILFKKPDMTFTANSALAGLVGITAGCWTVTPLASIIIGIVCGAHVVAATIIFEKLKIDDPVGAVSVHGVYGVCGAIGTLMAGFPIFSNSHGPSDWSALIV